jgi:transcriptional regulator with XRE-family HTH domain
MPKTTELTSERRRALNQALGARLKTLRLARGLTQLQLADMVGYPAYTEVSQVELGITGLQSYAVEGWAKALQVQPGWLALLVLRFRDPHVYHCATCPGDFPLELVFDPAIELPHLMVSTLDQPVLPSKGPQ